jgi:hypothetical protein
MPTVGIQFSFFWKVLQTQDLKPKHYESMYKILLEDNRHG